MKPNDLRLYQRLRGSILHPQWLTDRYQLRARRLLHDLRNGTILDVGSGNSDNARHVHESNRLVRLDYPETNRNYTLRPDVFGDARKLPIADGAVDAVFLFEVLEHIDDQAPVLSEIRRVLRSDGKLFISVPFLYPIHDAPHDFFRFTVHGLRHVLHRNGLDATRIDQHGNSFLVPIQLLNLALLELCKNLWQRHVALGLTAALLAYPLCLLNNLLALPLTLLPNKGAGNFGYVVVAHRR